MEKNVPGDRDVLFLCQEIVISRKCRKPFAEYNTRDFVVNAQKNKGKIDQYNKNI